MSNNKVLFAFIGTVFFIVSCSKNEPQSFKPNGGVNGVPDVKIDYKESHGGNPYSLRFVKTARVIHKAFLEHQEWPAVQKINLDTFFRAIENTVVALENDYYYYAPKPQFGPDTGQSPSIETSDAKTKIVLYTSDFALLNLESECAFFQRTALQSYLSISSNRLSENELSQLLAKLTAFCLPRPLSEIENHTVFSGLAADRNGNMIYGGKSNFFHLSKNFKNLAFQLVQLLDSNRHWAISKNIDLDHLILLLQALDVKQLDENDPSQEAPESLVYAFNSRERDAYKVVSINVGGLSYGEVLELIYHEVLPLNGIDDSRYQRSSQMFMNLPAAYYRILPDGTLPLYSGSR